ncbi:MULTISPECIES: nickel/cobalt efflux transporter [unclassified Undibacterium]|uniref:nickel/cobalt efflux transporter n=1 Tax=unclassified Undibacterium TaxID=2630295 RepID=UPI002AC9C530|nr:MULTISPECIES: nickel/cobalt efflux transporter [unclassified Undibacterium]MEB0139310.1 nickel/cobalt efflux transporter [Undibacterium sp. CCC2.1]MEB0172154.1 nickel/cobalt efflux transporter [Undibacterium sp. CCC1.1]MEB0176055.1 nickel/cobalt efflux transporter [Undibacterium sp. CCC3.4]MEB0215367.1 nickel/cobalt efflux transporter [Undibacterium sp. 5I2]WPX43441.1 nickel/cobalt efflux transporter [Undibacterium sp. CCC3.4]
MTDLSNLIIAGSSNAWLFIPSAIALGALHGLEPGHSKTMMAAFIIAIRGTIFQAVLLGVAAALSHTAVVWAIALAGLYFGQQWNNAVYEAYFQIASALLIIAVAAWMLRNTWQDQHHAEHDHDHHEHEHDHHEHEHDHQDAHERAHAQDIQQRFAGRSVTTPQILVFGLTGGLIPCPASITVLLLCLQLKKVALGATLVLCFSLGLALTMVLSGVLAALSVKHVARRWSGFGEFARKAPYISSALILLVGFMLAYQGIRALP